MGVTRSSYFQHIFKNSVNPRANDTRETVEHYLKNERSTNMTSQHLTTPRLQVWSSAYMEGNVYGTRERWLVVATLRRFGQIRRLAGLHQPSKS